MQKTVECGACGLVQALDGVTEGTLAKCARCRLVLEHPKPDSRKRTLALALAALILYLPANFFPILKAGYHGAHEETKMFDGIQALFEKGNYLVAGLVFTTSILAPGIKISGLLLLCLTLHRVGWRQFRTITYRIVQVGDPWSMLPVTLLAMVVSLEELGQVATVHPGPGVYCFAGMVVLTWFASRAFDPQLIWDENGSNRLLTSKAKRMEST